MSIWFYLAGDVTSGLQLTQGQALFARINSLLSDATLTEAGMQTLVRSSYTASNLWCRVLSNNGTQTIRSRKNTADGTLALSVTTTGTFEDVSHTDSLVTGDLLATSITIGGSHNNACTLNLIALLLDDGGTQTPLLVSSGMTNSSTFYTALGGSGSTPTGTESTVQYTLRATTTSSKLWAYVAAQAGSTAATLRMRVNGANGNQSLSYASGETGRKEDASSTDTLTAGDQINYQGVPGTGGNFNVVTLGMSLASSAAPWITSGSKAMTASTTTYWAIGANFGGTSTEANTQMTARTIKTLHNLFTRTITNTRSDATTLDLRVNTASSALTVSVGANTSGVIENLTDSVTVAATDLINFRALIGGGTGTMTLGMIGVQTDDGAVSTTLSVSVSDGLTLGDAVTIQKTPAVSASDALTLGDAVTIQKTWAVTASDALTLAETADADLFVFPTVTDALTVGETVTIVRSTGVVTLTLAVSDGVTLGETLTPSLWLFPTVTDGLTLGETLTPRLFLFPTVTDGLTVGELADADLFALPSIAPEVLTLGDTLTTVLPFDAAAGTDAVTLGETVSLTLLFFVAGLDTLAVGETAVAVESTLEEVPTLGSLALAGVGM